MKPPFLLYLVLLLGLQGCQLLPSSFTSEKKQKPKPNQLEQLAKYGSYFARELHKKPKITCDKYLKLHQKGDWRASWVLALTVAQDKSKQCINTHDAILVLTKLESKKIINSDLIWLNQTHLQLLYKLQENENTISQLNTAIRQTQRQTTNLKEEKTDLEVEKTDLEVEKEELTEKLEALKEIETNINQ